MRVIEDLKGLDGLILLVVVALSNWSIASH